jgi:DNA-binding CsgD family transcriptional regulator
VTLGSNDALVERSEESSVLRDAIAAVGAGTGQLVLIEGPAGIGKTALLNDTRKAAAEAGMEVFSARGLDLEREFAFGVARQLFEGVVTRASADRQAEMLAGAAALVRPLFGLDRRDEPVGALGRGASDIGFKLSHGFYWLTANLAEAGPVMLTLDDAQYADRSSLECIAYLAARLEELPVLLALTIRSGEAGEAEALLSSLRSSPETTVVTPRALTAGGVAQMVRARFGESSDSEFCDACTRASAGNPFLLGELLTELAAENLTASAANVAYVDRASPDSVRRTVLARLERLGPDAAALSQAVAVLEHATIRDAAELAGLETGSAVAAADDLLTAGVLTAEPLVFVHPLLRLAVYEQIPPAQRASDHARAALLLAAAGVQKTAVGSHLLRALPSGDDKVVQLLRAAAADAITGGDISAAITLLRRALAEPPGEPLRGAVLGELGQLEALAHDPASVQHLSEALELATEPAARVAVACVLGELLVWGAGQSGAAYEMLSRVLRELGPGLAPPLRAAIETLRMATASVDVRLAPGIADRLDELRELADTAGPAARALKIFEACWEAQTKGVTSNWWDRLDEGLDGGRFVAEQTGGSPIVIYATLVLVLSDEVARSEALLSDIRADARGRGSMVSHVVDLAWGAFLRMRVGELRTAVEDAQAALALARSIDASWAEIWMVACLCEALRESGEIDAASHLIESVPMERMLGTAATLHALMARARVRLARGERDGAISDLWLAGENVIVNNPSFVPWRSVLATTLASTDPERALELVDAELERARELGQPRGIGVALRARARLLDPVRGLVLLAQSVDTLRRSPAKLELAHALADQGAALRRAGQRSAARDPLREALTLAQHRGAEPLAEAAREELIISGARPRREILAGPEALTPSERRVAELAASGLQNREIAQALFVTTKTVGTHLAHIYQKLNLSGQQARDQLGDLLQTQGIAG